MKAGISTACFYPLELEKAFGAVAERGVANAEIFVNTDSELYPPIADEMLAIQKKYGVNVCAVHPYTCGIEPMMLFTSYERRVCDMLDYFSRFFEYMNKFGAKYFVLHGNKPQNPFPDEKYFERFERIQDRAASFGVTVAQENVSRCSSRELDFMKRMADALGDKAKFVLDTKQAHRSGEDPVNVVRALGKSIVHLHYSDYGQKGDCLKFGEGEYDNMLLFKTLNEVGFDGTAVIELYKGSYSDADDLADNYKKLSQFLLDNNF